MSIETKYKIFKVNIRKENTCSDFSLEFKLNPENDNDFKINMIISYELYSVEKFDQIIVIQFTINIEDNKCDIFVTYSLKVDNKTSISDKTEIMSEKIYQSEINIIIDMLKCIIKNKKFNRIPEISSEIIKKENSYNIDILELLNTSSTDLTCNDHKDDMEIEKKIYYHLNLITSSSTCELNKNIIYIIIDLIKFLENFNLPGKIKKQLCIKTLETFLNEKKYIHTNYIKKIICPDLIDILNSIDKRKITLKHHLSSCFFPFMS